MLSREDNERLTRVGPGTVMGTLLRHYWMPALLEQEIAELDGTPVRLRLLGEDLVAFRDTQARIGILEAHCAHRRAHLFFGRNEECGLRCIYHGWKYDVAGNCVDIPSEPDGGDKMKSMAKRISYPTAVRGGVVWIYMGPPEFAAEPPDFEWSTLPARHRTATKRWQRCNWAQAVDGAIDSSHASFLHSRKKPVAGRKPLPRFWTDDGRPVFEIRESRAGLLVGARRRMNDDESRYFWGITQFLMPFHQMFPPVTDDVDSSRSNYSGHTYVPIDDENVWVWSFSANPHRPYTDDELAWHGGPNGYWGPIDENYTPRMNRSNDYGIDRAAQRDGLFSGVVSVPDQDAVVQESMGAIVDRTRELLGQSDRAVVLFRRMILRLAEDCAKGVAPEASKHSDWFNVRPATIMLEKAVPFEKGAAKLLAGG
jgi:nitrite reductase/ring-hydroxylating ferredoxin subunit